MFVWGGGIRVAMLTIKMGWVVGRRILKLAFRVNCLAGNNVIFGKVWTLIRKALSSKFKRKLCT